MAINKIDSPSNPWQVDWTDPGGKRRRKRFATKREAQDFEATTRQSIRNASYIDPKLSGKLTVGRLYGEWIERIETVGAGGRKPASPKTLDNYRRQYANYVAPRWEFTPLGSVTYDATAAWITTLQGQDGKAAGAATRREVALTFGRLMGHAVKRRYLAANPAKDAVGGTDYIPEKRRTREHVYLTMPQLLEIAREAGDYETMILLAGLTGLRWGEITALTVADVTIGKRSSISVTKAYAEISGKHILGPTKGGDNRVVPVPVLLADRLSTALDGKRPDARIFESTKGFVLRNSLFARRIYKPAIEAAAAAQDVGAADFPSPTFHSLRHTAVSLAIRAGANVKVVQRIAGHASATMTLDTYAGLFDDDLHDSADRLNTALAALGFRSDVTSSSLNAASAP